MKPARGIGPRHNVLILCLALAAGQASAAVEHADRDAYELPAGERLEQELWLSADQATLAGETADDVSIFAKTITLSGTLDGDVHALASDQITFSGVASNQLRLAAIRIQVDGHAHKSLVALASSISLSASARLEDAAVLIADTVVTDGEQQGPLWVIANKATIQGVLHGDLRIIADDIVIQPGTVIHGNLTYSSSHELIPGSRVVIDGEVKRKIMGGPGPSYAGYFLIQLALFVSTLLIGLPLIRFFPRTIGLSAGLVRDATGRCVLAGLGALWILPLFGFACLFTPLTLPLGLVLLGGLAVLGFLAQVVVALVIGSLVYKQTTAPSYARISLSYAIGLLLLYILTSAPILSLVVWIVTITLGLGGLIMGALASQQTIGLQQVSNGTNQSPDAPPPFPPAGGSDDVNQPKE